MKARKVKKIDPEMPLADAAERILRVRVDELYSFTPKALDPSEERALHDMRIAAKRLRYLLELTSPCFGAYAATGAKRAKQLQDLLGEIHDCDVMLPLVRGHLEALRAADAAELRRMAGDADDLDPSLAARAPHRRAYRGLETLIVHLEARRELLFARFLERWRDLRLRALRDSPNAFGTRYDDELGRPLSSWRPRPPPGCGSEVWCTTTTSDTPRCWPRKSQASTC